MDFTEIDKLIQRLEKRRTLRPGSVPVMLNGKLGVWRTVRGFRMFIEVDSKGNHGRVLIGPPSFVGGKISDVADDIWNKLTPRETTKEFSFEPAPNGIGTLKSSILGVVKDDKERKDRAKAVRAATRVEQLVPLARSAGFTDEEIKSALKTGAPSKKTSGNVVPLRPENARNITGGKTTAPSKPVPREIETPVEMGNLARALEHAPDSVSNNPKELGSFLQKWGNKGVGGDDLLSRKIKSLGDGLVSGDYKISEVKDRLQELFRDSNSVSRNAPSKAEADKFSDRSTLKTFAETLDKKVEEAVKLKVAQEVKRIQPAGQAQQAPAAATVPASTKDRFEQEALLSLVQSLAAQVKTPQVQKEVQTLVQQVKDKRLAGRSVILRVLQIIRFLLAFIPGV